MTGLSHETEEVLRRARLTEAMPVSRRRRIKGALLARLAAAGGVALKAGEAAGAGMWATAIGSSIKGVASVVVIASLGAGGYMAARTSRHAVVASPAAMVAPREPAPARAPVSPANNVAPVTPESAEAQPVTASESASSTAPRVASRAPLARAFGAPQAERSTLAEEMPLLRAADRALRAGKVDAALAWLDQHAARFPDGVLAPEQSGERLVALCQLGKADRATASRFLASHEGSPLAARVRQACGLAGR